MTPGDYLIFANDGTTDHIARLDADSTVSNARITVLSLNPTRFRDNETGREFGLEDASVVEHSGNALFAKFEGPARSREEG